MRSLHNFLISFTNTAAGTSKKVNNSSLPFKIMIMLLLSVVTFQTSLAVVNITAPSLTVYPCPGFPTAYSTLGNIIITEGNNADFQNSTAGATLVLAAPANFEFEPGIGSVSRLAAGDITAASINVTASAITITFTTDGNPTAADALTISGIRVRGITAPTSSSLITRGGGTPAGGTAVIAGAVVGGLTYGTLISAPFPSSNAGTDQIVCAASATFQADPVFDANITKVWTLVSGGGTITTPNSSTSTVTGLSLGDNIFRWTISMGGCSSSSIVTITSQSAGIGCTVATNFFAPVTAISPSYATQHTTCPPPSTSPGITEFTLGGSDVSKFNVGDKVLVIQMQGAIANLADAAVDIGGRDAIFGSVTDYNGAGNYEYAIIATKVGNVVTFSQNLLNSYNVAGKVQLVSVPQFANYTVSSAMTGTPWDGPTGTGGVLVFEVLGTLTLNNTISMDGKGFLGGGNTKGPGAPLTGAALNFGVFDPGPGATGGRGVYSTGVFNTPSTGIRGEGIAAAAAHLYGRGALANGGGSGGGWNSGAGGGSNVSSGGRGGYEFSSVYTSCGVNPKFTGCVPTYDGVLGYSAVGLPARMNGVGGYALTATDTRVFLGGGGGAANGDAASATAGGNGGGIIIITASTIAGTSGTISANGQRGYANNIAPYSSTVDGTGGGGGGGSVILDIDTYTIGTLNVTAKGGKGGNQDQANTCHGNGGGGGGGFVRHKGITPNVVITTTGGNIGVQRPSPNTDPDTDASLPLSNDNACAGGTTYGATPGLSGSSQALVQAVPQKGCCSPADLGADQTLCGVASITLLNGTASNTNKTFQWYKNGILIGGATAATYNATSAGLYSVMVDSTAGGFTYCSVSDAMLITNAFPTPFLGPNQELCDPAYLDLSPSNVGSFPASTTWSWTKDGLTIPGEITPYLTNVTTAGTYALSASASGGCGPTTGTIVLTSIMPVTVDGCSPSTGTVNLSVSGGNGGPYEWYPGQTTGSLLTTGTTYAPTVSSTTTYWVEDKGLYQTTIGPPLTMGTSGSIGATATINPHEVTFDLTQSINLRGMTLRYWANSCGGNVSYTINITNSSTAFSQTRTGIAGPCGPGAQTYTVTFATPIVIPAGTGYAINATGSSQTILSYSGPFTYPSTYNSFLRLVKTTNGSSDNDAYPSLFDWNVSYNKGCGRVPVVAEIGGSCAVACSPPTTLELTTPLIDTAVCAGSNLTLTANFALGTPQNGSYYITWFKDGVALDPAATILNTATTATRVLSGLTTAGSGVYKVRIEDGNAGSAACYMEDISSITVNATTVAGVIGSAQTICYGATPATLTSTTAASGGTGTYVYQWESSPEGTTWTSISGAISPTYSSGALISSIYYRRGVTSGVCPPVFTSSILVTVNPQLVAGTVGANQTICFNTIPAAFTSSTLPTGGSGTYTYAWQKSTDNVSFTSIGGATAAAYAETAALTQTTYYRRTETSCGTVNSNVITVTVNPQLVAGTVAANQTICYNTIPAAFTSTAVPTGGTGAYTYVWQKSTDNVSFAAIGGATSAAYAETAPLTQTTYYQRTETSGTCGTVSSNTIIVTVNPQLVAGTVAANQTICYNAIPAAFTSTGLPTGGTGSYTYAWQKSTDNVSYTAIGGATSSTYAETTALTQTTYYQRRETSGTCGTVTSNTITVTVSPQLVAGTVGANQTICFNTIPTAFTSSTLPTGGSGTYTYAWQKSTDNVSFTSIGGATAAAYAETAALTQTTYYRRTETSCGTVNSNVITVTVNPLPNVSNTPLTGEACDDVTWSGLTLTSDVSGATFAWTSVATSGITGNTAAGSGNIPSTTFSNSNLVAGTVTYTIIATANTCSGPSSDYVITVKPAPSVTGAATGAICSSNALNYDITADISGSTFTWNRAAIAGISNLAATGQTLDPITETLVNTTGAAIDVPYIITPFVNGCSGNSFVHTVTVNISPSVTNTPLIDQVCENVAWSGLTLTADLASPTFTWTSSASSGITGNTLSGSGNLPADTYSNSMSSVGSVTYTIFPTASGCQGASVDYVVNVNPTPVLTNTPLTDASCDGAAWPGLVLSSDVSGTSFDWTSTASSGITGNTASGTGNIGSTTFDNSNIVNGTVTYSIVPIANTCIGVSSDYVITVKPAPSVTSAVTGDICSGNALNYDITADISGATFTWNRAAVAGIPNAGLSGQNADPITETLNNTNTAATDVNYVITPTADGCTGNSLTYTVTVNLSPVVTSVSSGSICSDVAQSYDITSNIIGATFLWSRAAVTGISNAALTGQTADPITESLSNTTTSPQTVTYVITPVSASTCPGVDFNYTLTVNPVYLFTDNITASEDTICEGSTAVFTVNNISADSYTNWVLPSGATILSANLIASTVTVQFGDTGGIISVSPVSGCTSSIPALTSSIVVVPQPVANAGSDLELSGYGTVNLDGSLSSTGSLYTYQWTSSDPANTIVSPTSITTTGAVNAINNLFVLTVQGKGVSSGCSASDAKAVKILAEIFVPTAFSPNEDGNHDEFEIKGIEYYPDAIIKIYNQWGELVFKSSKGYLQLWDGKKNGKALPIGTYYYVLHLKNEDIEDKIGYVSILK